MKFPGEPVLRQDPLDAALQVVGIFQFPPGSHSADAAADRPPRRYQKPRRVSRRPMLPSRCWVSCLAEPATQIDYKHCKAGSDLQYRATALPDAAEEPGLALPFSPHRRPPIRYRFQVTDHSMPSSSGKIPCVDRRCRQKRQKVPASCPDGKLKARRACNLSSGLKSRRSIGLAITSMFLPFNTVL